jgi:multiple sugar transport system ATP-binding protein
VGRVAIRGVSKRFGDVTAVDDLTLDVADEEFLVLLGPSGCGKSTALRMIAGLEEPTEGTIEIGEREVNDVEAKDRDVAMVFQSYALYPHMTVRRNVEFPLKTRRVPAAERNRLVQEAAGILGLEDLLERKPAQLSGGQRQRVALARAIVRRPQAFLMDEPLSNLDAALRVEMRTEILTLHRRIGVSTVYVTHDQVEAMTMGDRVAVMRGGVLQQFDTPKTLYERPCNIFVAAFIGSPAINLTFADVDAGGAGLIVANQRVSLARPGEMAGVGRKVVLGIRPEAFAYERDSEHDVALTVMPQLVEFMGSEVLVHFSVNPRESAEQALLGVVEDDESNLAKVDGVTIGKPMVARLDTRCPATAGQEFTLWVSSRTMQMFDAKTGATLA